MIRPCVLLVLTLAGAIAADAGTTEAGDLPAGGPSLASPPEPEQPAALPAAGARVQPSSVSGRAVVSGGYDSNVLLLADESPTVTGRSGPAYGFGGEVLWRAIATDRRRLNLAANAEYEGYSDHDEQRMLRFGVAATGMVPWRDRLPALTVLAQRYLLDGDTAADVYVANLTVAGITQRRVSLPSLEVNHLALTDNEDASGTLVAAGHRHWWLLQPGDSRRRIEAGLRLGTFLAGVDQESYLTLRPELAFVHRFGEGQKDGTIDLATRISADLRRYRDGRDGADEERQTNATAGVELDRWFGRVVAGGVFVRGTLRESTLPMRDFDRVQTGLRLIATF